MTAEEAFRTLKSGSNHQHAWDLIVSNIYQPLLAYVASLLLTFRISPGETASDVVHEVLIGWYERDPALRLHGIDSLPSLSAYLRASCRNLLIDKYRHERSATPLRNFLTLKFESAFQDESGLYKTLFLEEIIKKMPEKCATLFTIYATNS
jgi:DNA-directed RNA polymerase specialized sigma24 family protein